jgi:catechol 2,3-dioxygenase-like lactoylglutathione lyase family enzyme
MVGLVANHMEQSLEFYRRLGLDIPEGSTGEGFGGVRMQAPYIFFLTPNNIPREQATTGAGATENLRVFFEFYLKSEAAVRAKYAEMTGYGYESYRAPFHVTVGVPTPARMCFALINDPDGNTILLSGDAEQQERESNDTP